MEPGTLAVFIDAGVLFAAGDSARGASREVIHFAQRGQLRLVLNKFVLLETAKNLAAKRPQALPAFETIQATVPFQS